MPKKSVAKKAQKKLKEMSQKLVTKKEQKALKKKAKDHLWMHAKSWEDMSKPDGIQIFTEADGTQITDIEGNSYFDIMAGLWLVNSGHGRQEIMDAVYEQMKQLSYVSGWSFATLPAIELATKLAEITPGSLNKIFFVNSGSDATDAATRMAKQYQFLSGFEKRYKIIGRRNSYHGSFSGAHSLTGSGFFARKYFEPMMPGIRHVPHPYCYRCQYELEYPSCDMLCAKAVEQEILYEDPETVAAVIGETIAGAPGVIPPPPEYWPMVRAICDKYGVLLIMDEVICGFGRTGKMFACEHFDVVPDIMAVAKGLSSGYLPIAATIAKEEVHDKFKGGWPETFQHGTTWGAHPVCCAAALANVNIIEREDLPKKAAKMGKYLMNALKQLESHPTVGDVRGKGLLAAIELVKNKKTKEGFGPDDKFNDVLNQNFADLGLLTRVRNYIAICPPLIVTQKEIDELVQTLDKAFTRTEKKLRIK